MHEPADRLENVERRNQEAWHEVYRHGIGILLLCAAVYCLLNEVSPTV